jgi:hypothetical protein
VFILFFVLPCDFRHTDFYEELNGIQIFEHRKGWGVFGPEKKEMDWKKGDYQKKL